MNTTHIKTATLAILTIALTSQTGCYTAVALLKQSQDKKNLEASQAKFQEDLKKGDVAMLEPACQNLTYEERRLSNEEGKQACDALSNKLVTRIESIECERVPEAWEASKKLRLQSLEPIFMATFERAAACEDWNYIMNDLVVFNARQVDGTVLLTKLEEKQQPVETLYLSGVTNKAVTSTAFGKFANWRKTQGEPIKCTDYKALPLDGQVTSSQILSMLLSSTECTKDAVGMSLDMLLKGNKFDREFACKTLGEHGSPEHQEKIGTVAVYDKEWDVRRECDAAWGQIKLRHQ